jgi:hypothetical protein
MDTGLQRSRHRRPTTSSSTAFSHRRECNVAVGIRRAREPNDAHGYGDEYNGHERQLEREWHCRWKHRRRNDHGHGRLYRASGFAFAGDRANHGDGPRRCYEIRHRHPDGHQRHHPDACAKPSKRGAGCDPGIPGDGDERRTSRHHGALDLVGRRVSERMWGRGLKRHVHRTGNSALTNRGDAHGAKRGGSFEADFCHCDHHQQLWAATFRAIERARGRKRNDCCHAHAGSEFQSQHCAGLVAQRSRLQRIFL